MPLGIDGIDMAFDELKLEVVYARILPDNQKSIRFHLKLSFELLKLPEIAEAAETLSFHTFVLTKNRWRQCRTEICNKLNQTRKQTTETSK